MNDTDRKFLMEWGGEKWHKPYIKKEVNYGKCYPGQLVFVDDNRTFDNWTDFGFLWSRICQGPYFVMLINFLSWLNETKHMGRLEWESTPPATRCQLICDFLKEGEK